MSRLLIVQEKLSGDLDWGMWIPSGNGMPGQTGRNGNLIANYVQVL